MKTLIRASRVVTPHQVLAPGEVLVESRTILGVGKPGFTGLAGAGAPPTGVEVVDAGDCTVIPGMIDLHNHGALGSWVGDSPEAAMSVARHLPSTGTTGWLPTVGSVEAVRNVAAASRSIAEAEGTAELLGIHMEGPFLAPKNLPGEDHREPPPADLALLDDILAAGEGLVRLVGISPELPGAMEFVRELRRRGVVAAVAHTKAGYGLFKEAVIAGLNHVTHSYNVMTGLHHRRPGVVGGVLTEDGLTCELIADGYHVHPVAMKVLLRCKGSGRICLITDNVRLAGLPDGTYDGLIKKDGTIRKAGYTEDVDGTLAGSAWPMVHNLSVLVREAGASLQEAVEMASLTPAKVIGVDRRKGSLEPGKDADMVALEEGPDGYSVKWTMVGGKKAWPRVPA